MGMGVYVDGARFGDGILFSHFVLKNIFKVFLGLGCGGRILLVCC
jgi:hypothetical protein